METLRQINEWGFQIMMLLLIPVGIGWLSVGMVEATKIVAREWFKPEKKPSGTGSAATLNTTKQ